MKYYLSSFRIGNQIDKLKSLLPTNLRTAYIANALDFMRDSDQRSETEVFDIEQLQAVGLQVERFDLQNYFTPPKKLARDLDQYGVIWVRGGNVFVLRQAMRLSGLDTYLIDPVRKSEERLYGGYSAGICVLAPSLHGLELVDDETQFPYQQMSSVIWEGLGLLDYALAPHYRSDHPESAAIENVVGYYRQHSLPYKTLQDGDVIVIE
jgi:dipeptidase E